MGRVKIRKFRTLGIVSVLSILVGSVLLVEAAATLWYRGRPPFLPASLDVVGPFLSLLGASRATFGGAMAAALMGLFLICVGAIEFEGPRT